MKLELGKMGGDGVAACGHPVLRGEPVLVLRHSDDEEHGCVAVCMRGVCSHLFMEADAKLDATSGGDLAEEAHAKATAAHAECLAEWHAVDRNVEVADKNVETEYAAISIASEEGLAEAEAMHKRAVAHAERAREHRDQHHARARRPAFHAAIAWAETVRRA